MSIAAAVERATSSVCRPSVDLFLTSQRADTAAMTVGFVQRVCRQAVMVFKCIVAVRLRDAKRAGMKYPFVPETHTFV